MRLGDLAAATDQLGQARFIDGVCEVPIGRPPIADLLNTEDRPVCAIGDKSGPVVIDTVGVRVT